MKRTVTGKVIALFQAKEVYNRCQEMSFTAHPLLLILIYKLSVDMQPGIEI